MAYTTNKTLLQKHVKSVHGKVKPGVNSEVKDDVMWYGNGNAAVSLVQNQLILLIIFPLKLSKLNNSSTEPWSCTEQEYFITSAVSEHPVDILEVVVLLAWWIWINECIAQVRSLDIAD